MTLSNEQFEDFLAQSAAALRRAWHSDVSLREFLVGYLQAGRHAGLSQGELINYLAVSSPSVLERASLDAHVQDRTMELLASLQDDELR